MPLRQEDFRGRRCGESNGARGGYGSFSVSSGGPPKAFWRTFLLCFMKASSVIDSCFLLGRENPPSWLTLFCFQPLLKCKKPWMSLCSSVSFLLTPQASLCFSVPGIQGSIRDIDWGSGHLRKHLWRKQSLPRTRREEPGASLTVTQIVEHLGSSDTAQALFPAKT